MPRYPKPQDLKEPDRAIYVGGQLESLLKLYEHEELNHITFLLVHGEYEQLHDIKAGAIRRIQEAEKLAGMYPESEVVKDYMERMCLAT